MDHDHEWNLALKLGKSIVEIKHMLKAKSQTSMIERSEASPFFKSGPVSPITEMRRLPPTEQKDKKEFVHIQMD